MSSIDAIKAELRREAIARRDAMPAETRAAAAEAIAARAFPVVARPGTIVSGFMPIKSEINPLPLMKALTGQGARLALPVIAGRGAPLVMRPWKLMALSIAANGAFARGRKPDTCAEVEPDIASRAALAFDRAGHRIGYGAEGITTYIAALRERKPINNVIGLAFAAQEVPAVPATPRDARLDLVLTEREVIDLR